ncbi:PhzF family phenazine biosynthesis protein [Methylobacterium sp. WL12]|uniref:PhzF family phenazine biosynthesis protein n=1 Tax=Methylobacterium sp. WL12 TaxID=2603890 RepID=UPI002484C992|nr:PhzF family phenazine biosynthesis protein [Methylobacterium sp. WL12]
MHHHRFRFFVPNHEMEMCAHSTIGALWVLARKGRVTTAPVRIATASGPVTGFVREREDGTWRVEITQPAGRVVPLAPDRVDAVCAGLGHRSRSPC